MTGGSSEIHVCFFDQKGLMGGIGLQGTKITKINK
jgi:lipid-binding SYLF domain-containing protein